MGEAPLFFCYSWNQQNPNSLRKGRKMRVATEKDFQKKTIWSATITEEMVSHLSDEQISFLIDSLNEAVAQICDEDGVK